MTDPLDHDKLLAEIDEEVRRRRESGDIPADLERELDLVFARFAPVDALEADFEQVLTRAEQATFIDTIAPVESSRPVIPYVKRVIRKVIGWYVRYVAQQTSGFAHAITRAVRLLGERVDAVEEASPAGLAAESLRSRPPTPEAAHWGRVLGERLAGTTGRVLVAEANDGALARALAASGLDVYTTDPSEDVATALADEGIESRVDEVAVHLRALPDGALGAVVLNGCVDRLPAGALVKLAALAQAKVAPGGTIAVVSADPHTWRRQRPAVAADLSPGHPLHPETWVHLLGGGEVVDGPFGDEIVHPVPDADPVVNENFARIARALWGPSSYAVLARRA